MIHHKEKAIKEVMAVFLIDDVKTLTITQNLGKDTSGCTMFLCLMTLKSKVPCLPRLNIFTEKIVINRQPLHMRTLSHSMMSIVGPKGNAKLIKSSLYNAWRLLFFDYILEEILEYRNKKLLN